MTVSQLTLYNAASRAQRLQSATWNLQLSEAWGIPHLEGSSFRPSAVAARSARIPQNVTTDATDGYGCERPFIRVDPW
jgi:hypothetical protein